MSDTDPTIRKSLFPAEYAEENDAVRLAKEDAPRHARDQDRAQLAGQLQAMERRAQAAEKRIGELERDNSILNGAQERAQQECARLRERIRTVSRGTCARPGCDNKVPVSPPWCSVACLDEHVRSLPPPTLGEAWTCSKCGYMSALTICTKCGRSRE